MSAPTAEQIEGWKRHERLALIDEAFNRIEELLPDATVDDVIALVESLNLLFEHQRRELNVPEK